MYKWAYRQYRKKEYVKLYLERNAFSGDHMGRVSRKAGSGNRRSLKRSRGSRDLEYHHAGIVVFWNGILEIGSRAGLVEQLSEKMRPALKFLFPDLPPDCEAARQICVNFIANILGLGWAATPAGLKAMKELEKVEEERRKEKVAKRTIHAVSKGTASNEMCTFLIMNISSLQLIPVNIIAYRSQYHSTSPAAVTGPCFAATMVSTLAAVIFCKIMDHLRNPT